MKIKILLTTISLMILFIAVAPKAAKAQNLSDCFARKIANPDIVCSLCGTDLKKYSQDECDNLYNNRTYDAALCSCIPNGDLGLCSNLRKDEITTRRNSCYSIGGFWAETYCECYERGNFTKIPQVDEQFENLKDDVFFDTNFDGSIDNFAELVRMGFIIAFAAMSAISAFIGFYGMGLYSTAGENDEQVKKAQDILKNGLIGVAIAVLGVAIVQIVAVATGVADSVTDTTFEISEP